MNNYYKELFNGRCPYNDKHCDDFNCVGCEVNENEKRFMKENDMYRVIANKTYECLYVGFTEDECVEWCIENHVDDVFIEKYL